MVSTSAMSFLVCLALVPFCQGQGFLSQKCESKDEIAQTMEMDQGFGPMSGEDSLLVPFCQGQGFLSQKCASKDEIAQIMEMDQGFGPMSGEDSLKLGWISKESPLVAST